MRQVILLVLGLLLVFGCAEQEKATEQPSQQIETPLEEIRLPEEQPITETVKPSPEECEKISNFLERDFCFFNFAKQNIDPEVCALIQKESVNGDCHKALSLSLRNADICGKASTVAYINSCYKNAALEFVDVDVCSKIPEPELVADCQAAVAIKKQDPSICQRIQTGIYRDKCIAQT